MSEYEELEVEFEQRVEELQKRCPHEKVSEWCKLEWAPGHTISDPLEMKFCMNCNATVRVKAMCHRCGNWSEEYEEDDSRFYCKSCLSTMSIGVERSEV